MRARKSAAPAVPHLIAFIALLAWRAAALSTEAPSPSREGWKANRPAVNRAALSRRHEGRVLIDRDCFGNRSLAQTTCADRAGSSGDFLTASPPARRPPIANNRPGSPEFAQERDNRSKEAKFIFREIGSIRATRLSPQPPPRNRVSRGRSLLGGDRPPFQGAARAYGCGMYAG